jgi:hypothetical protein
MFARALTRAPYTRIQRPLACFRRTGKNNSVVNPERTARENGRVRDQFGPGSQTGLMINRYFMKAWLNAVNPAWSLRKVRDSFELRAGIRKVAYF